MKMRSTDFDRREAVGALVVELEATWRPDPDEKPRRIRLNFDVQHDGVRSARPIDSGWIVVTIGTFWAMLQSLRP